MLRNLLSVLLWAVCLPVLGQEKDQAAEKLSPELKRLIAKKNPADSLDVSVSVAKKTATLKTFRVLSSPVPDRVYTLRLPADSLLSLAARKDVLFISRLHPPKEEINTGASDPTLNGLTYAQNQFPQVRGEAIVSSLKERLLDTTDIDLKKRVLITGLENNAVTAHASLMATIMAGAGNSSPFARGAAPAAVVTSSSFNNLFPDADSVFQRHHISVQNHSYGTTVENFYGNEAVAYDQSAINNPQLVHVFSAGNSGATTNTTGPYTGVTGMANLSGNFKQAKNIITVSAVDSAGQALPLSSKGPAYDGRVKPELVAYGEDGSSGAAALTSGAVILVQDLYKQLHAGNLPSSQLTKAVLLNSADDAGEKHVDYSSGYGSLNADEALRTVKENRYIESSVLPDETKRFSFTVPANAAQAKLTLVWTDLPAAPNAAKALVNDLDLVLQSASGESWLPWVLDHQQTIAAVLSPAQRKIDTLNNVEQITVDNPAAGTYTIDVKGSHVQLPAQAFAIAYQVDTANTFYWTFPTATDPLVAGRRLALRWHTNITGAGRIEYATQGNNWRTIGEAANLATASLRWTLPDTVTTAQLRMVVNNRQFLSDTFTISPQPNLQTGFSCADSFLLYWNNLDVTRYRLYQVGEAYLEAFTVVSDTAIILSKTQHPSFYYSIAPVISEKEGIRSNTLNYDAQGAGCYLRSFYLEFQTKTEATFTARLGTVYNVAEVSLEKITATGFSTLQAISAPQATDFTFSNIALQQGENRFRLKIRLTTGVVVYSDVETVYTTGESGPVLFYPNPVSQGGSLKIFVSEVGRYSLEFYDVAGRKMYKQELNSSVSTIQTGRFSKGLYLIRIVDKDGTSQTVRQIVY